MGKLISVTEYAKKYSKDPGNIRRALLNGRLEGIKVGRQWCIDENIPYPEDKRRTNGEYRNWRRRITLNSNATIKKELTELKLDVKDILGDKLYQMIVYGSFARGEQTEDSDLDIALILKKSPTALETKNMYASVAKHELNCGIVLSVIDINLAEYIKWKTVLPLYINIERDGIILWRAQ